MVILQYVYIGAGCIVCLFLGLLAYSSGREKRPRAVWSSLLILILFTLLWFGWLLIGPSGPISLSLPLAGLVLFLIMFFFPTGSGTRPKYQLNY